MAQASLQLPAEIWTHIFGYLSPSDRFSVRTCCKFFRKLVDHPSLWRGWTVVLPFKNGSYNSKFWSSLRRRDVRSVVMRSSKVKHWGELTERLPGLSTVVMDQTSLNSLPLLTDFPHLTRLAVRDKGKGPPLLMDRLTLSLPQQLTNLSLCVRISISSLAAFIPAVSKCTNLTSLVCHCSLSIDVWMINSLLACLPKLKHLSLSGVPQWGDFHSIVKPNPDPTEGACEPTLSSLELVDFSDLMLPEDAMRSLQSLTSLAVFYEKPPQQMSSNVCNLTTWLRDLPRLSTLVIVKGPPVKMYVSSIPASVTSLTLRSLRLSQEDMAAVALQVPNLLHLHVDPWPLHLGARIADIIRLFPNLKSLKLRHEHVPVKDFLLLHKLRFLEHLEILDNNPFLFKLIGKLQALTRYRVLITTSPQKRDVLFCPCV